MLISASYDIINV